MPNRRRLLPKSLRWQFILAVAALALLISAGGLTAVYALRVSSSTIGILAEERLARMQESLDLVQRTLLIERESYQLASTDSISEMRESYAAIVKQLEVFDHLVERIAAASDDAAILELHQASQLFRNTANIVAQLRESELQAEARPPSDSGRGSSPQHKADREFEQELRRQAGAMVASARLQTEHFTRTYREAALELARTSRRNERWVMVFLAGSLLLAWLVAHKFLGRHVLARLQQVSHNLRLSEDGGSSPVVSRRDDEIDEMARAVERFQEDRRQLAQRTAELLVARDAADAANKAKSIFLANMSHELRTPLNAILGFSSLMSRAPELSAGQRENLAIINRSGEHLLQLINDVLEMAKIEAGRVQLEIAPFDLGEMVLDAMEMMRLRAREKGLRLQLDQSSEFPRYITGDEARLRQILINLVSNALKFTDQGGVTVRLGVRDNHRHHLVMEIEDTGPGIAPEDQQRVFEPFVQLADGAPHSGSGLGLSITRQFVQLMGGTIALESTPGKGSLFRVDLPLELAAEADIRKLEKPESRREVVGLAAGQPSYRILIAEDQLENQLLLSRLMSVIGLEVKVAENGEECVRLFQDWHPDLIWMDRRMPVMDGVEAARRIRQLPGGREVRIVAVTASAFKEQQQEMSAAGMDDFVPKPYRFDDIYNCLERQLGVKYIYRVEAEPGRLHDARLMPGAMDALPAAQRSEMKDALETLDSERIAQMIRKAGEIDPELGSKLLKLAENFDYQTILNAIDGTEG